MVKPSANSGIEHDAMFKLTPVLGRSWAVSLGGAHYLSSIFGLTWEAGFPPSSDDATGTTLRVVHAARRCGALLQLIRGPTRSWHELAVTVWTASRDLTFRACDTEGALEGADARLGRIGRQVAIATFTTWTQLEHG